MASRYIKGMVCVEDITYRIVRADTARYEVIRLKDEFSVGSFVLGPKVVLAPQGIDATLLRRIAREAIQRGKTSWVFHESPKPPAVAASEPSDPGNEEKSPLTPRRLLPA